MLLDQNDRTRVVSADIGDPGLMCNREVNDLIDFDQPTAVLLIGVMHCLPDDVADRLIPAIARWLTPTSYIAVSHLVSPHHGIRRDVTDLMRRATRGQWGRVRESSEVGTYLKDQDLLMPGLCDVTLWNPDPQSVPLRDPGNLIMHGGVAVILDRTR
jgi:O-methyltransferase involved in polyketide biosynthesis